MRLIGALGVVGAAGSLDFVGFERAVGVVGRMVFVEVEMLVGVLGGSFDRCRLLNL